VTKDGSIAGPRMLEHLVDVVLQFEGERHSRLRLVRAVKNRFGATDEVGCFDLSDDGIHELPDPSGVFMTRRSAPVAGSAITVALEGRRPLVAEVQALVAPSTAPSPRRAVSGLDSSRVAMALAVVQRRAELALANQEVFVSTVGGVKLTEPATDLAIALAVASAANGKLVPIDLVAFGEVGLAGDIRPVPGLERRVAEAARLGFTRALVPVGSGIRPPEGMRLIEVADLSRALQPLLDSPAPRRLHGV
jgi:DNA repair protein RadA/Sms